MRSPRAPGVLVPRTLRARVSLLSALAVLVVLVGAGGLLVLAQRSALVDALDETLERQADVVAGELRAGRPVDEGDLISDDVVVTVSDGATEDVVPPDAADDEQDEPVRVLERTVDGAAVRVTGDLEDVDESVGALLAALAVVVPLATAVLAALLWWAVGRALRPVERIRSRVDAISGARLDRRVPEPARPEEVARLARTMNAMLDRLQTSADEQRRFVADASHELRSPLARMRAELEVDAAHPDQADRAATAASALAETVALQRLVDDLLLLARGDAGALAPGRLPVDLDDVLAGPVRRARATGVTVDDSGVHPVQVPGDAAQVARLVDNLLANAVRHARRSVVVTLVEQPPGTAVLTVADDGPGIRPADRDRVFERFTRLDEARAADDGGAGLGLAIARDVAERHGGTLRLAGPDPCAPGACFVLTLPAVRPTG